MQRNINPELKKETEQKSGEPLQLTRNKIRILMSVVESYELNIAKGRSQDTVLNAIIPHFLRSALDKNWYRGIIESFLMSLRQNQEPRVWLAKQFEGFRIFQVSEQFQRRDINQHHCMSFVCDFLNDSQDDYLCDMHTSINQRIKVYLRDSKQISPDNLKLGDTIVYRNNSGWAHIALCAEKINGETYAISKFGERHDVLVHPVRYVPETYGEPICYNTRDNLNSRAIIKFGTLSKEMAARNLTEKKREEKSHPAVVMNGPGLKLRSGPIRLWSFDNQKNHAKQDNEAIENNGYRP
jgi:hypothetical protein